jgi:hypothetical protein
VVIGLGSYRLPLSVAQSLDHPEATAELSAFIRDHLILKQGGSSRPECPDQQASEAVPGFRGPRVLALLIPSVPPKIKEFAYFGFGITLISASIAHFSSGDGVLFVIDPLLFLGALIVSYWHFNKLDHEAHWVRP